MTFGWARLWKASRRLLEAGETVLANDRRKKANTVDRNIQLGFSALTRLGRLQVEESDGSPYPMLKAVVGSGSLNMNPAVVFLEILEGSSDTCEITITAAAKEGLIKQHTAEKAVQRVASEITTLAAGG